MSNIHEFSSQSDGAGSLTHSILINLLIKLGLNNFLLPPMLSVFLSQELLGMCLTVFMGVLERCCPTTWCNKARTSNMFLFDLLTVGGLETGKFLR